MATTSSNLVAGKLASKAANQGGNRNNGRFGLKAKLAAGVAVLGCAAALAFGGLPASERAQSPAQVAQPASNPHWTYQEDVVLNGNPALAAPQQSVQRSGGSYEDLIWELENMNPVSSVARSQTEAGAGYLEYQPGEGSIVSTGASHPAAGIGLREYLDGESPLIALPVSSPTTQPAPDFGPQP